MLSPISIQDSSSEGSIVTVNSNNSDVPPMPHNVVHPTAMSALQGLTTNQPNEKSLTAVSEDDSSDGGSEDIDVIAHTLNYARKKELAMKAKREALEAKMQLHLSRSRSRNGGSDSQSVGSAKDLTGQLEELISDSMLGDPVTVDENTVADNMESDLRVDGNPPSTDDNAEPVVEEISGLNSNDQTMDYGELESRTKRDLSVLLEEQPKRKPPSESWDLLSLGVPSPVPITQCQSDWRAISRLTLVPLGALEQSFTLRAKKLQMNQLPKKIGLT